MRVAPYSCYQLDPTNDPRWTDLVERHPRASVFHTVGWLNALKRTYGYEPVAFTTSSPTGDLNSGIVFCRINSWLTGRRLVSLPFSDHCEPLCDSSEEMSFLLRYLQTALDHQEWKYVEVRPVNGIFDEARSGIDFQPTNQYFLHTLDLRPNLNDVFEGLDKDSVQRRILHAERSGLTEKRGSSEELLKDFYNLFVVTRSRHRWPPTPYAWFRNLTQTLNRGIEIHVAYKEETPVASILTLRFRDVLYYKYGCSDTRFNPLGATSWLLWRAISKAKSSGATGFDMGRTEEDHRGLLAFKNHWAPTPKQLVYWNYPAVDKVGSNEDWKTKVAKTLFHYMPKGLLTTTGRLLYRHIG